MRLRFAIPADAPQVDGLDDGERFALDHAAIIVGTHVLAVATVLLQPSWTGLAIMLVGHVLAVGLGITVGFHRTMSHAQATSGRIGRLVLATLGTLAMQGGPLLWVATHRAHHRLAERRGDPHASTRGFWWSHIGWTFYRRPNGFNYARSRDLIRDLVQDPALRWLDRHALALNLGLFGLAAALSPRLDLVLWAFPVRIVVGWHATWLLNSYAHAAPVRGDKRERDALRDSTWLALLIFGEGWHRTHHRQPGRPNLAPSAWHVDFGYRLMRLCQALGGLRIRATAGATTSTETSTE